MRHTEFVSEDDLAVNRYCRTLVSGFKGKEESEEESNSDGDAQDAIIPSERLAKIQVIMWEGMHLQPREATSYELARFKSAVMIL